MYKKHAFEHENFNTSLQINIELTHNATVDPTYKRDTTTRRVWLLLMILYISKTRSTRTTDGVTTDDNRHTLTFRLATFQHHDRG